MNALPVLCNKSTGRQCDFLKELEYEIIAASTYSSHRDDNWHLGASAKLSLVRTVRHRHGRDELRVPQFCAVYGHGQRHWGVLHRQYAISAAARAAFTAARLSVLSMAALSSTSRRLPWRQCNCAYDKRPRFGPGAQDQRGCNRLHGCRLVVEEDYRHAGDGELKIGSSGRRQSIFVASEHSRHSRHRKLGASANEASAKSLCWQGDLPPGGSLRH